MAVIGVLSALTGILIAFDKVSLIAIFFLGGIILIQVVRNIRVGIWLFPIFTFFSTYDPLGIGFSLEKILMGMVLILWLLQINHLRVSQQGFDLKKILIAFGAYLTICFLSQVLNQARTGLNFSVVQSLVFKGLLVFLVYNILSGFSDLKKTFYSMGFLSTMLFVWMITIIILKQDLVFFRARPEDELMAVSSSYTIFANPNIASFYGVLLYPLMLSFALAQEKGFKRTVFLIITLFTMIVVLLTFSRSGLLALLGVTLFLAVKTKFKKEVFILLVTIGIGIFFLVGNTAYFMQNIQNTILGEDTSALARIGILKASWISFAQNPLLGVGYGNFSDSMTGFYSVIWELPGSSIMGISSHNDWLNILVETGILGFVAFCALAFSFIKILTGIQKRISQFQHLNYIFLGINGSLLAAFVDSFFHKALIHNLLWFVIGLSLVIAKVSTQEQKSSLKTQP